MEVYLVEQCWEYEGFIIVAAFLDKEKAEELAEKQRADSQIYADDIVVVGITVT